MNFETSEPFDKQLSQLLAIIIMCEKNIEEVRKKLAGNEQFHSRLIFQRMNYRKKGQITPEDIVYTFSSAQRQVVNLTNCQKLCRKYTISGAFTYQQLISILVPKTDKSLSQRMLIRTTKRGSTLPNYLWKSFCQLLLSIISMTTITEQIRKRIQNCSDINYLEMVQFFKSRLKSENYLWKFCNINSEDQYDFTSYDVRYLSNHVRSGNMLRDMTDEDIKQLICPLDMNFQKTVHEMAPYYENLKNQKQKTMNGFFFQQTKNDQIARQTTTTNFLKSTYQPFFTNTNAHTRKQNTNFQPNIIKPTTDKNPDNQYPKKWVNINIQPLNIKPVIQADDMILKPSRLLEGSEMYLDNFIKPISYDNDNRYGGHGGHGDRRLSNDYRGVGGNNSRGNYIGGGAYGYVRDSYQRFDDPLPQNLSSEHSNSAFVQY